jgi:hypothetical protein
MVLVGYWPLNESSGSTAKDHSGNENHGSINDGGDSTVPGATGVLGQNAYSFDGSNNYVEISSRNIYDFDSFSVSLWIKTDGNLSSENFYTSLDSYSGDKSWFTIQRNPNLDKFGFSVDNGSDVSGARVSDFPINDGEWHHVVGVRKKSQGIYLYIDSESKKSSSDVSGTIISESDILIGARSTQMDRFWNGKISEVRIYNHALTPREIQYLYQVGNRGCQVTSTKTS